MPDPISKMNFPTELAKNLTVHSNVRQEMIVTTSDKARLCLYKHIKNAVNREAWIAPAGLSLALLTAIVASDFKDALGLDRAVWKAVFVVCLGLSIIWLIRSVIALCNTWTSDPVEEIVKQLKSETGEVSVTESGLPVAQSPPATKDDPSPLWWTPTFGQNIRGYL